MPSKVESLTHLIRRALTEVGLPKDPNEVVGRTFTFGRDDHFICGEVISIGYGPQEGLKLYVSAPRYEGMSIGFFGWAVDHWVCVETKDGGDIRTGGVLQLL